MCQRNHIEQVSTARDERTRAKMQAAMTNPAEAQRVNALAVKYTPLIGAAKQKGDTAAVRRLTEEMYMALAGENPRLLAAADTASARRACGAVPARATWMAQYDSLQGRYDKAASEYRDKQQQAATAGAGASGMPADRYNVLRERLEMLVRAADNKLTVNADQTELDLVKQHRDQLRAVERALL